MLASKLGITMSAKARRSLEDAVDEYEKSIPSTAREVPASDTSIGRSSGSQHTSGLKDKNRSREDSSRHETRSKNRDESETRNTRDSSSDEKPGRHEETPATPPAAPAAPTPGTASGKSN